MSESEVKLESAVTHSPGYPSPETEFEKRRGISKVEVRYGFAQAHISDLPAPLNQSRLGMLDLAKNAQISIDFLKFSQTGLSFLVAESSAERVRETFSKTSAHFSLRENQCIVLIHAVNMRDEEGLIAKIMSLAISTGAEITHIGDMHDRLLLVTNPEGADKIVSALQPGTVEVGI